MNPSLNEKFLAYLALFSGITLSIVAEYYSILGLMAIFAAAPWSIVVMGVALGVGKITATLWLKQNWAIAPWSVRAYLLTAISVLMLITSMGIFGFLSKAHIEQAMPLGDNQAKVEIIDERIAVEQEIIEQSRKEMTVLNQQIQRFSELGAVSRGVTARNQQREEREALNKQIAQAQTNISQLRQDQAPYAASLRAIEAEVGPIKYIAQFVYGEANPTILEKAVTWVIIILIVVFDPLALILLLASQISFQNFRERKIVQEPFNFGPTEYIPDPGEEAFYAQNSTAEGNSPSGPVVDVVSPEPTVTNLDDDKPAEFKWTEQGAEIPKVEKSLLEQHPYLLTPATHFKNLQPMVYKPEPVPIVDSPKEYLVDAALIDALEGTVNRLQQENEQLHTMFRADKLNNDIKVHGYSSGEGLIKVAGDTYTQEEFNKLTDYVQNEEQAQSGLWKSINSNTRITEEEYLDKIRKQNDNSNNAA